MPGKAQDVFHRRCAERIDRLSIVTDDCKTLALRLQRKQNFRLESVRVLVLVDEHVIEQRAHVPRKCRFLHGHNGRVEIELEGESLDARGMLIDFGDIKSGMKQWIEATGCTRKRLIAINSGANLNFDRLRHISERADIGEHREALIAVEIPEKRGAFLAFCQALGSRNVTEFNYRYAPGETAKIFVGLSLSGARGEAGAIVRQLESAGYRVQDLSDNELAKLHIRHMVGGPVPDLADELIYRFEFPERPGALLNCLNAVGVRWNISLFHYRNHGSDYGRVLAGIQVPARERTELIGHLDRLGYAWWPETDNPAYRLFLGPGRNS